LIIMKVLIKLSFFPLFIILLFLGVRMINSDEQLTDVYLAKVKLHFEGRIIEKNLQPEPELLIKAGTRVFPVTKLTQTLFSKAAAGDSLIKIANSNCCYILRDTTVIIMKYADIPAEVLNKNRYLKFRNDEKCY